MFYDDEAGRDYEKVECLPKEVCDFNDADGLEEGKRTVWDDVAEDESDWRRLELNNLCELFLV